MKLDPAAAHRRVMTEQTATLRPYFAIGRMTATERAAGRFLRSPDEHPPADPAAEPAPAAEPTSDASLIAAAPAASDGPAAPARPDGLADQYWDAEANTVKPEAFARLAELEAAEASRGEGVPETAEGYELTLSEEILGADGKPVAFAADDPLAQAILPVLHAERLPQTAVSNILAAYAKVEVAAMQADAQAANERRAAEVKKLGPDEAAVKARTSAVHGQLVAALGAEPAEAIRQVMTNADAFMAIEAMAAKLQQSAMSAAPLTPAAAKSVEQRLYPNPSVN